MARSKTFERILKEMEEYEKTPEGQEDARKTKEEEEAQGAWTKKVKEEHGYDRRRQSPFLTFMPQEMSNMEPDLEWMRDEDMFDDAMFEACNWDETTAHSHMAMKFVLYRIIMPKEKWHDKFDRNVFLEYADKFFDGYYNNH
jgi:hypothetical protein